MSTTRCIDTYEGKHGDIPLGHYCRQSLVEHLDAEELVKLTAQGFEFFEELFDYPYPFGKYDQLYVPEYNMGAMENAGCVTLRDEYLPRSRQDRSFYEFRAEVILHEMAHMWFGDLVTMKWWDDLWLNESFAEWACYHAAVEATEFDRGLDRLHQRPQELGLPPGPAAQHPPDRGRQRRPARGRGQLRRHHLRQGRLGAQAAGRLGRPRELPRGHPRLLQGLRVLQLRVRRPAGGAREGLGPRARRRGPRSGCRPRASTRSRRSSSWTPTARYTSFSVRQTAHPDHPTLRRHRLGIGLYDERRTAAWSAVPSLETDVDGELTEVAELVGQKQPDLLLLNEGDLAYAKIRLDERSLATVVGGLATLDDSLARALCWGAAWDMTRDAEMSATDFVALVLRGIGTETDAFGVSRIPAYAAQAVNDLRRPRQPRRPAGDAGSRGCASCSSSAEPGSDHQLSFVRAYAAAAHSDEALADARGPARRLA